MFLIPERLYKDFKNKRIYMSISKYNEFTLDIHIHFLKKTYTKSQLKFSELLDQL
jgi:hypothetical protein